MFKRKKEKLAENRKADIEAEEFENEEKFSGKYQHKASIEQRIALFNKFLTAYLNWEK